MSKVSSNKSELRGFMGWVERTGNKLPDPVVLFCILCALLIVVSVLSSFLSLSAFHPVQKNADGSNLLVKAVSLLSAENIRKFWVEMPTTFTHFHPLGYVLVVMLGAGVAEKSGLFGSALRLAVNAAPKKLLTPVVALVAMLSNHAADAGYVVLIPLAGILFAAAGRHPLAGIATAFAGVSGGFSANVTPGQLDALLFGITETAIKASNLDPNWKVNIAGNWWFITGMTVVFLPVIWYVTDRIVEPNLPKWIPAKEHKNIQSGEKLSDTERSGVNRAIFAALMVGVLWVVMATCFGSPLWLTGPAVEGKAWFVKAAPLFQSMVGAFFILFLAMGWAYGKTVGTVQNSRDLINMMSESMKDLGYYLVLAFVTAHFVAMFAWSNLGLIFAIHGAQAIQSLSLPVPILMTAILLFTAILNLFIGSASAKWGLMAPILVPMLMLLGISPETTTAVYRVGDGATNIITPLMVYFPLILVFAKKWQPNFGIGSLTALMMPYSIGILISGGLLVIVWVLVGFDLGPSAGVYYTLPGAAVPTP
jgi:aminobenzoyl-glutamate transport protein